ncbi:Cytochrome c oxidase subunit VIb [Aphelenchoides besseyi]|nr:Cytochrome c oxidase subunit VIb [Aphelenchoides besseyi]
MQFIVVDQLAQQVLMFSMISRGFLTICFCVVVAFSPTLMASLLFLSDVPKHLRLCYFVNLLNSLSYLITFAINQPNLILPSPFALFRGALKNRFGAVGLTISWANVISGVIVTMLMRLYADVQMSKLQRMLVTAIIPVLVYVIFTMNYMDETHLSTENLSLFQDHFPFTELSKIYSLVQFGSFGLAIAVAFVVFIKQVRCQLKFAVQTSFHLLAVILTLLCPWAAVFAALYAKPSYGMEMVTISWIVSFFYPLLEICCILNYIDHSTQMGEIKVPETFSERLLKSKGEPLPNPNSPNIYDRELHEKSRNQYAWAAPYDARFPQVRKTRQCFAYYVDYHRCQELVGSDYKPCNFFRNVYKDFCPKFWVAKWDELIEEGRFPAKFDR